MMAVRTLDHLLDEIERSLSDLGRVVNQDQDREDEEVAK